MKVSQEILYIQEVVAVHFTKESYLTTKKASVMSKMHILYAIGDFSDFPYFAWAFIFFNYCAFCLANVDFVTFTAVNLINSRHVCISICASISFEVYRGITLTAYFVFFLPEVREYDFTRMIERSTGVGQSWRRTSTWRHWTSRRSTESSSQVSLKFISHNFLRSGGRVICSACLRLEKVAARVRETVRACVSVASLGLGQNRNNHRWQSQKGLVRRYTT